MNKPHMGCPGDMNLKKVLMELGNRMVTEAGYDPSGPVPDHIRRAFVDETNTEPIALFTEWVNLNPRAQEILRDMGVEWPMDVRRRA